MARGKTVNSVKTPIREYITLTPKLEITNPEILVREMYTTPISRLSTDMAVARYLEEKTALVSGDRIIHLAVVAIMASCKKGTPKNPSKNLPGRKAMSITIGKKRTERFQVNNFSFLSI